MTPIDILKKYWGYSEFRPSQIAIIQSILNKSDTFALLPTGGGKSICFQVPSLLLPGITIVVSPLISLMKDQVDALVAKGIKATYLASSVPKEEQKDRLNGIKNDQYKIIYVSPERLQSSQFLELIESAQISLIVVDEAHCVSVWGHDFRPEYQMIAAVVSKLRHRPILAAFTATATKQTEEDIIHSLGLVTPNIFTASFKRNIAIKIIHTKTKTEQELQLFSYLQRHQSEAGIVYVSTRHHAETIATQLNRLGGLLSIGKVGCYHGGLAAEIRQETQQKFLDNKLQILVATTAFGMGIDKSNIQFVIHYHPSASIENYFQEIGRAGRGGQIAEAVMLLYKDDFGIQQALIKKSKSVEGTAEQKLNTFVSLTTSKKCYMVEILKYFNQEGEPCGQCSNCLSLHSPLLQLLSTKKERWQSLIEWRKNISKSSRIQPSFILQEQQMIYLTLFSITKLQELLHVPGIGKGWMLHWGKALYQSVVQ
jgi:ATP-dependent DNA helicase RecQ